MNKLFISFWIFWMASAVLAQFAPRPTTTTAAAAATTTTTTTTTTTSTTTKSYTSLKIINGWKTTTGTGYNGITADVYGISYDTSYVYISANSIPSYTIGPTWTANPNTPGAQAVTYKFPLSPSKSSNPTTVGLGAVGLWKDGVAIYNANDGQSYNSAGVWYRNAKYWEGISFDACNGHADGSKNYHNHVNPICMSGYSATDSTTHSPLLGFMFDGYPMYGPFGYSSANVSTSSIKRMTSGYSLRSITDRTTYPTGASTPSSGPPINSTYPLGSFMYDYAWSASTGDLDAYNGRWCVTPEYPSGTYAYFVTTDSTGAGAYPYTIGTNYYGVVGSSRSTTVPSTATKYF